MASVAAFEDQGFGIGRVLSRAFATVGANARAVFGIALLIAALPQTALALSDTAATAFDGFGLWPFASTGTGSLLSLVTSGIVQAAMTLIAVRQAEGGRASFGEALWAGIRPALPLIGLSLLMALSLLLGFALMVFPGVMLWVAWSVTAPALAEERCGVFGAFGRSRELTRGARWHVLALLLLVLIFHWLFTVIFGVSYGLLTAAHASEAIGSGGQALLTSVARHSLSASLRRSPPPSSSNCASGRRDRRAPA